MATIATTTNSIAAITPAEVRTRRRHRRGSRRSAYGADRRLTPVELFFIAAPLAGIAATLVVRGEAGPAPSLAAASFFCIVGAAGLAFLPTRAEPQPLVRLQVALFAAFVLFALWTASSLSSAFAAPAWRGVAGPGAAAIDRSEVLSELLKFSGLVGLYGLGRRLGEDRSRQSGASVGVMAFAIVYGVGSLAAYAWRPGEVLGVVKTIHQGRFTATLLSANTAGALFGVFAAFATARVTSLHRSRQIRSLASARNWQALLRKLASVLLPLALFVVAVFMSESRTALIASVLALVGIVLTRLIPPGKLNPAWAGGWKAIAGALFIAPFGASALVMFALTSTSGPSDLTFGDRHDLYVHVIAAARDRPWLGYGLGGFRALFDHVNPAGVSTTSWIPAAAHSVYLQWWLNGGLLGAGLVFGMLALALLAVIQRALGRRPSIAIGVLGASLVLLLQGAFDYALEIYSVAAFWSLLLGLGGGEGRPPAHRSSAASPDPSSDLRTASFLASAKASFPSGDAMTGARASSRARVSKFP